MEIWKRSQTFIEYAAVLGMGFVASIWWLPQEDPDLITGSIFLLALWVLVFNFAPIKGWSCLRESKVKYFFVPVAVCSSFFYLVGILNVYT